MNKTVDKHLENLINFYSETDLKDSEYLKKLFVRNLKDVLNRYNKYVIPELLAYKDSTGKLLKEVLEQQHKIDKAIELNQYIIDYGFDYDGFNNVEDLKDLIDMLVDYAIQVKHILGDKE